MRRARRFFLASCLASLAAWTPGAAACDDPAPPAMPPDRVLARWDQASPGERQALRNALSPRDPGTAATLCAVLAQGSADAKLLACEVLGQSGGPAAAGALHKALWDPDPRVQAKALVSLQEGPGAAEAVRAKLADRHEPAVLKSAVAALGRLGDSDDIDLLAGYLADDDEAVRVNAAAALARLGDAQGEPVLVAALDSPDPQARREATYALGLLDSPEALARLEAILSDPRGRWRTEAEMALALRDLRAMAAPDDRAAYLAQLAATQNEELSDWARAQLEELEIDGAPEAKHATAVHGRGVGGDPDRSLAAHSFVVLGSSSLYTAAQRQDVARGTVDEDGRAQPINHFYNPVTGLNTMPFARIAALGLATNHWTRAVTLWHRGRHDGKGGAYHFLGRSLHLLQDMTSPAHVHDDPHVPYIDSDDFEFWGEVNYDIAPEVLARLEPWEPEGWIDLPDGTRVRSASPAGMMQHMALFTYRLSSFSATLQEARGLQPDSELARMFPDGRLYYQDGGLLGAHYWQIEDVGRYGGRGKDRWWPCAGDFSQDTLGTDGARRIVGNVYIENIGGNRDDLVPAVFERPLAHVADPAGMTFLEIYAGELYVENVRFGAAYLQAFEQATAGAGGTGGCAGGPARRASGDTLTLLVAAGTLILAGRSRRR